MQLADGLIGREASPAFFGTGLMAAILRLFEISRQRSLSATDTMGGRSAGSDRVKSS
jgi:hypothetical protein